MDVSSVALFFSAIALAVALLSLALTFRVSQIMRANAQATPLPRPRHRPVPVAEDAVGAWRGNTKEGYVRGPFSVRCMPTRGADGWRENETEWVVYRDGERAFASPDLEDVLRACETAEWEE